MSATYSFHASSSAIAEYWCTSFGHEAGVSLRRRHAWAAFVEESIRNVASDHGYDLVVADNLDIDELVVEAFAQLGSDGVIKAAEGHTCDECSHTMVLEPNEQHLDPLDFAPVSMVVVDGLVAGPTVSFII